MPVSLSTHLLHSIALVTNGGYAMPFQAVIKKKYGQDAVNVGDEGGFAPNIQVNDSY